MALADVACKSATRLVQVWSRVESRYQQAHIGKNIDQLRADVRGHRSRMRAVARMADG